jgi:O-antigen ligase
MSAVRSEPTADLLHQVDLGLLYVLCVPLGAGLGGIDGLRIGGANYTGPLWLAYFASGALLVLAAKIHCPQRRIEFPYQPWLAWFGFVWLSLTWGGASGRTIQDALQISMPLLVGVAGSIFIRTEAQLHALLCSFWPTLALISALVVVDAAGVLNGLGLSSQMRATGLTTVLIGCVFVAASSGRNILPMLGWGVCVLLTAAAGSRMATAALLLIPLLHPLYRSLLGKVALAAILAAIGIAVFHTETFQRRFFHAGRGTLSDVWQGNFLSFGRLEAWPKIWAEAWQQPYLGHGVGSVNEFVPLVWPTMNHAHNDYLRVGFELGIVGIVLFLLVIGWQILDLRRRLWRTTGPVQRGHAAALLGLLLFLVTACTDNPLVYNLWYMNPLFALMGAAYGVTADSQGLNDT